MEREVFVESKTWYYCALFYFFLKSEKVSVKSFQKVNKHIQGDYLRVAIEAH